MDLASLPVELLEEAKIPMGSFNDVAKAAPGLFWGCFLESLFFYVNQKMVGFEWVGGWGGVFGPPVFFAKKNWLWLLP